MSLIGTARNLMAGAARQVADVIASRPSPTPRTGERYPAPVPATPPGAPLPLVGTPNAPHTIVDPLVQRLAPPPAIDRYPIIFGAALTLNNLASASRQALTGYRYQIVDLLDELLDHDPHAFACLQKRTLTVAGGRIELTIADCDDSEKAKAEEIRDFVALQFDAIPYRSQRIASLLWAIYYGLSGAEIEWDRNGAAWETRALHFVHSRRLSYPNYAAWDVHIWDQGNPVGPGSGLASNGTFGIKVADYPGKFIVHSPSLRGNYPTREGLGRILMTYMALKRMVVRVSAQDFERFVKPWVLAYYSTKDDKGFSRSASKEDINDVDIAVKALGAGSLAGATLPDSVKIEILKAATALNQSDFLEYLDAAISKAVLGQAHTMQSGRYGSRSTAEVGKDESLQIFDFDADCLCSTLREQLFKTIVSLNFPGCERLTPVALLHVDAPDRAELIDLATKAAGANIRVNGEEIARTVGLPTLKDDDEPKDRMAPLKAMDLSALESPAEPTEQDAAASEAMNSLDRAQAAGISSPTLQSIHRTNLAHATLPGADARTRAQVAKEIHDAALANHEHGAILREAQRAAVDDTSPSHVPDREAAE